MIGGVNMALIKCVECGKEISDKARQCPKCGWKIDLDAIKNTNTLQDTEIEEEPIIEIEPEKGVPCFEPTIEENASSDYKEQAKENQRTNNIAYHDVDIKSDREIEQDICEDKTVNVVNYKETSPKKKGKFLKGVLIAGIALIVLGVWSVGLVNMTASMIVKNLSVSTDSVDVVESDKVVIPESTNTEDVEVNQSEESTDDILETEDALVEKIEEPQVSIEINDDDLVLENGIIINRETTTYNGDIYSIVNAKITNETDSIYEMGIIMNAKKIDSIFTDVKLQCLDEDGFEIKYFYIGKPATIGEFTSSCKIPKETKKIQICSSY